jgi:hypothetical protein
MQAGQAKIAWGALSVILDCMLIIEVWKKFWGIRLSLGNKY